ncbi:type II toxin-antitoxin system PemK/MazF family toxin [Okeania sp. SIO3I5]|nr:type II toxin-antitoxin system PemK/MazF family toxin [Okeania sp. SIO3I5]
MNNSNNLNFYTPKKGDIVWINFNPQSGREQAGRRPAVVVSSSRYDRLVG